MPSFSITHIGSDCLLGSHSACHVDTKNLTPTHHFPLTHSTHLSIPYHGFTRLYQSKTKPTQSILMKTFVVFTSGKMTRSSWRGSLNTLRVFDLAAKRGFLVFLSRRDFFWTKMNCCFSRKEETNLENKNGKANDRRLQRQTLRLCCEFLKMKLHFCFTKVPIKMPKTKENSILGRNQSNSILNRTKPKIKKSDILFLIWETLIETTTEPKQNLLFWEFLKGPCPFWIQGVFKNYRFFWKYRGWF